jgi:Protein of unknown function (DUF2628)
MITVTVHEPPMPPSDRLDRAERLAFVKDGYNWIAAAWPPLWMIGQRLWWALAAYAAVFATITFGLEAAGLPAGLIGMALLALHLLIGLEADSITRWTLDRTGWQVVGTVVGRNLAECERRFFDDWLPKQPIIRVGALRTADVAADRQEVRDAAAAPASGAAPKSGWRRALGNWAPDIGKLPAERG